MTNEEIQRFLEDNGYPAHVVQGGREYLLRRYREFVSEVERGYDYGIHEYRHDLDLRGAIQMLDFGGDVAAEDEQLAAMLIGTDDRVWESMAGEPFWDFGYPRNVRGKLKRDLLALGLIRGDAE